MILFIDILLINGQFEDAFLLAVHPGMYMYVRYKLTIIMAKFIYKTLSQYYIFINKLYFNICVYIVF